MSELCRSDIELLARLRATAGDADAIREAAETLEGRLERLSVDLERRLTQDPRGEDEYGRD